MCMSVVRTEENLFSEGTIEVVHGAFFVLLSHILSKMRDKRDIPRFSPFLALVDSACFII